MIIQTTADGKNVLFNPENLKERRLLEAMPAFSRQGLNIFVPNKKSIVYNLYTRCRKKIKDIKYTSEIKALLEGDIKLKEIPSEFLFHTTPLPHQLIALRFAYTFGCFGLLLEPGLGKTKIILDFIWLMQLKKSLIICPKPLRFVWEDEVVKHRPELKIYVIKTTDWELEKKEVLAADVVVINYDKAVALLEVLQKLQFDFLGVDEGLIKNPSTDRTKAITKLSKGIPARSIMSGTLVNNSPLDIFAPIRMIEPSLVGEAFGKFRDEYAIASRHNRYITVGYRNVNEVKDILSSCSIIMKKEEWLKDLPPKEFKHIYVQMGDQQRDYYQKLANNYLLQLEDLGAEVEVDNPLTVLIKLTQISNGFLYYQEDTDETLEELYGNEPKRKSKIDRKTYFFEEQPKALALISLLRSDNFKSEVNAVDLGEDNKAKRNNPNEHPLPLFEGSTHRGATKHSEILHPKRVGKYNWKIVTKGCNTNLYNGCLYSRHPKKLSTKRKSVTNNVLFEPGARRAIIWFNMAAELSILESHLRAAGISFLTISGGDGQLGEKVHRFNKDPSIGYLLCQAKTINYGVTIMGSDDERDEDALREFDSLVSDEIFYSQNFSLEVFLQQQDRIHRIGQTRTCRYWILLTNSPIERRIAERLEEKLLCNKEILVDISKALDLNDL